MPANAGRIEAFSRAYGPKSAMLVARPTLRWEVWPGGRGTVTAAEMVVNDRIVEARYDPDTKSLVYTPDESFAPGLYRVKCRVVINGSLNATKEWAFSVTSSSARQLPEPDQSQIEAFDLVNRYRSNLGLSPFRMDERLNAASLAHSQYLLENNTTGHFQKSGKPGFIGATPGERFEAFGFVQDSWEGVDYGAAGPEEAIRNLFEAPYHRIPFLQPGSPELGSGYAGQRMTLGFGSSDDVATVVSPGPGEADVPTVWDANERPHPLRVHQLQRRAVGFPIVLARFSPDADRIKVENASLSLADSQQSVPIYLNTPDNDNNLRMATILMAREPLRPQTRYQVQVSGYEILADGRRGKSITRTWSFSTR